VIGLDLLVEHPGQTLRVFPREHRFPLSRIMLKRRGVVDAASGAMFEINPG
jgi:hypothetical protein